MKKLLLFALTTLLFLSCKKGHLQRAVDDGPVTLPAMRSIDLGNAQVRYLQAQTLDLNGDGAIDFVFKLQLVGDPQLGIDRRQLCVQSGVQRNLLLNEQDETPVFGSGITLPLQQPGFHWWEVGHTVLAEKIVGSNESWWDGIWKTAQHRFLAVQVQQGADRYAGWVELSIDQQSETMTLHRAALNLSPGVPIVTGR
ncbi:MAG: hypothetical protein EOO08_15115 [Chitinophagaceae bacterium]|nr:MAG: hypothetical protein EOO08_15115 [Chitinophagaceae bacterium]